jgi:hypothetical protein
MSTPEILYQNLLKISQAGRGDGTIYAHGTGATPVVADKTFDLTTGYTEMADLTPGDDLHNGHQLVFTVSGRSYLIIDWVTASELATVFEPPNAEDTGAWTIRRTLYTDDFNVSNPIRYGSNGQLEKKWIDKAANNTASIFAAAENGVTDGGFELNSLNDYWVHVNDDTDAAINAGSPILGTYDCKLDIGSGSFCGILQVGKIDLKAGYTYGIILKAGGDGGAVTDLRITLRYVAAGGTSAAIPMTFSKTAGGSGDTLTDEGNGTNNLWKPAITDANAWEEVTFTVSESLNAGDWSLRLVSFDSTDVFIDEVYLWCIGPTPADGSIPNPDTLIIAGHNMAGGFANTSYLDGYRVQADRSSLSSDDWDRMIDLDADVQVDGGSTIFESFAASTSIFPIYVIQFALVSGKTWEAAEIWVGKRWTWDRFISGDWEPVNQSIEVVSSVTIGGNKRVSERYEQKLRAGTIATLDDDETAEWESFIREVKRSKPFWYYIAAIPDLGLAGEIIFMRNRTTPKLPMNADRFRSANYDFEEVL